MREEVPLPLLVTARQKGTEDGLPKWEKTMIIIGTAKLATMRKTAATKRN